MTTLENSYCKPKTDEEWKILLQLEDLKTLADVEFEYVKFHLIQNRYDGFSIKNGKVDFIRCSKERQTEIPVQHFIDLLEDRITPWRLHEMGFFTIAGIYWITSEIEFDPRSKSVSVFGATRNEVKTFTDLLTLIKFLK